MTDRIVVLHLRASSGSGGGPEKTILKTGGLIDTGRFLYLIAYLRKKDEDISAISQRAVDEGLHFFELPGRRFIDPEQLFGIGRIIKRYNVRILHCHDPKTDFFGFLLKLRFPKMKLVSTVHGWTYRTRRSAFYNRLDKWALRRFSAVIAVSMNVERIARGCGISRTTLIYNAIDTDEWHPHSVRDTAALPLKDPGAFVIGYVGRISREKGPLDFVRVAEAVRRSDDKCEFVVAGEGPEFNEMRRLAEELRVVPFIHFLGQVSAADILSVFQRVDLLLSTSYTEGLPNNILEALSMGVPVVATRVGGVSEVINHNYNGLLTDAGDIDLMAEYVLSLKEDQRLTAKLIENGLITVREKFSFQERVKKIEKLYDTLLKRPIERPDSSCAGRSGAKKDNP